MRPLISIRNAVRAVGIVLAVIGLAGLPDDIAQWREWLEGAAAFLSGDAGRWAFVIVGLTLIAAPTIRDRLRPALTVPVPAPRSVATSASPPIPIARAKAEPTPEERIEANVTPEYLWGLFEGRTGIQAQAQLEPFIGKWMRVSGPFGDVLGNPKTRLQVTFAFDAKAQGKTVYMYVHERRWIERFVLIKPGDQIVVLGRIARVMSMTIELEDCELIG